MQTIPGSLPALGHFGKSRDGSTHPGGDERRPHAQGSKLQPSWHIAMGPLQQQYHPRECEDASSNNRRLMSSAGRTIVHA